VNIFNANYRSAVLYSKVVDPIFQEGVTATGTNLTFVIEQFRHEIQHNDVTADSSITKGQWWFDNMTRYLDTILIIQQELASIINGQLEEIIQAEEKNLTISACFLVIVILMCPLVIYTVESLTSDIQRYAIALVHKTKELSKEKKKMDELLYQMVPKPVAERLKTTKDVNAEYFKSVTIMFSDIYGFSRISQECSPLEIVNLLNYLYTEIDERLDHHDVYKVEAINDSYMVASGLPTRIGNRHSAEVANLALDLMNMVVDKRFSTPLDKIIQLRIGINTGPCMAGIVGTIMPRYCLFGDAVNTASRMKSYCAVNKIHISTSTYNSLRKHGVYVMSQRGKIMVKGKGSMMTYWLLTQTGCHQDEASAAAASSSSGAGAGNKADVNSEPGEVQGYFSGKFGLARLSGRGDEKVSLSSQLGACDLDVTTSSRRSHHNLAEVQHHVMPQVNLDKVTEATGEKGGGGYPEENLDDKTTDAGDQQKQKDDDDEKDGDVGKDVKS